jgi:hypothetical protein
VKSYILHKNSIAYQNLKILPLYHSSEDILFPFLYDNKKEMEEQTGISSSMTDENIKDYLQQVIEERQKKKT